MLCSEKVKLFAREHPCGEATVDGTRYRYPGVSDGDVILPTAGHITSFQIHPSIRPQPLSCALGKPKDQSYEIGGEGMFPLSPRVLHSWFPCIYII